MQALADAGFRSIISNRPDGEDEGQPSWEKIERAARDAGMEARHIAVIPGAITDDDAGRFATALDEMPEPVVGFCRTGMRSVTLWALANPDKRSPDDLIAGAADAGYDIAPLRDRLARG
jgi:sulfide:quinone oxidoreductase